MVYILTVFAFLLVIGICEGVLETMERRHPDWADEQKGPIRW